MLFAARVYVIFKFLHIFDYNLTPAVTGVFIVDVANEKYVRVGSLVMRQLPPWVEHDALACELINHESSED